MRSGLLGGRRMPRAWRQTQADAMRVVQPPPDVGPANPAMQGWQVRLGDPEALPNGRDLQQIQHIADRQPRLRQRQQRFQRPRQGIDPPLELIGHGERQKARIVPLQPAEHSLDGRRVDIDLRHHHDDLPGPQGRVGIESRQ